MSPVHCFHILGLEEEIKSLLSSYEKEVKKLSEADRKANLCLIQEKFDKMKEYSDDKVQLAVQMYEMVSCICCICAFINLRYSQVLILYNFVCLHP